MSNNYEDYSNTSIESLTFLWGNSRNRAVYNRFKLNNIDTLRDLFIKYDNNTLVFPGTDKGATNQAIAIIELIRYYYLQVPTTLDIYLDKEIKPFNRRNRSCSYLHELISILRSIGLEERQAVFLSHYISDTLKVPITLGDYLIYLYKNHIQVRNILDNLNEDLKVKICILVDYQCQRKNLVNPNETEDYEKLTRLLGKRKTLLEQRASIDLELTQVERDINITREEITGKKM